MSTDEFVNDLVEQFSDEELVSICEVARRVMHPDTRTGLLLRDLMADQVGMDLKVLGDKLYKFMEDDERKID